MHIKNKDLLLLVDINTYLIKTINTTHDIQDAKMYHDRLTRLIARLLITKKRTNAKNWERIKEKRKFDKNYAREIK